MRDKLHWKLSFIFFSFLVIVFAAAIFCVSARFKPAGLPIFLTLIFILGLFYTFTVFLVVSKPLRRVSRVAEAIAAGDFSRKPSLRSQDEIGELGRALGRLSEHIKEKIETIKQEGVRLDAVLSSMSEGLVVTDEKGQVVLMNPSARGLFAAQEQWQGKKPIEVTRNNQVQDIVERLIGGRNRTITEEIIIVGPEEKIIRVSATILTAGGSIEGAVLVFHDITQLRSLEKMRQDFVANVSHELRTPASSIQGYAETLLEGNVEDKDRREFIRIIHQDSQRLANLIEDLLDLSRIESGKMDLEFIPVHIKPLAQKVVSALAKAARKKSLVISVDIPDDAPKVMADDVRLPQVFFNLVDNAIKYTPEGGSVQISASTENGFLRIEISDTGIGIPEKDLPRIFERFYRVDKARSRELGGTGLGLAIVKHIVAAHGGSASVRSVLAAGSTFSFTVPLA